jgi:hypothetical protein
VQLSPGNGLPAPWPRSDSGPFRATIQGVHLHRDLTFGAVGMNGGLINNGVVIGPMPGGRPGPAARPLPGGGQTHVAVQFSVDLHIAAEPRMILSQTGPIKLAEAIDDKGQSLLTDEKSNQVQQRYAGYLGGYGAAMAMIVTQVQLQAPAQPGQQIRRLRGSVPLLIAARKEPPMTIPLADAKGRTFQTGDLSVTIHNIRPETDPMGSTSIELSVRPNATPDPLAGANRMPFETFAFRSPQMTQSQVEILDAQGRAYPQWITSSMQSNNEETRMTLRLMPNDQVGAPAQLRLFDMARAQAEAHFDFREIPIP